MCRVGGQDVKFLFCVWDLEFVPGGPMLPDFAKCEGFCAGKHFFGGKRRGSWH